jgi:hypothetical protein
LLTCFVDIKKVKDLFQFSCAIITVFLVGYINIYEGGVEIQKIPEGRGHRTQKDIKD